MKFNEIDFSLKNFGIFIISILALFLLYAIRDILLLFIISIIIAYLLNPIVEIFVKIRIPRFLSVLLLIIILLIVLIILLAIIVPSMIQDITYLISHTTQYINNLFIWIEDILKKYNIETTFDLETSKNYILERLGVISKYILNTLSSAAVSVKNLISTLINIFIVPVLVFFLLADFPSFKKFINQVVERFNMHNVIKHLSQFETLIGKYFRGMFLVGIILSCLYGLVLFLVGVKGWLFFGMLTGFGAMIPYVGFAVGLISSVIATIYTFQDILHPIYTLIGFIIVQILESMVITPKIVGDSLGINPVVVIVGLMIGGALAGFIGMILALPVAAFIKIAIDKYIYEKPIVKEEEPQEPPSSP